MAPGHYLFCNCQWRSMVSSWSPIALSAMQVAAAHCKSGRRGRSSWHIFAPILGMNTKWQIVEKGGGGERLCRFSIKSG